MSDDVIDLVPSPDLPGVYERARSAAVRRGHGEQTAYAGFGGLLGGVLGSFRGPLGAAVGALLGALLGAFLGQHRDRSARARETLPVRRPEPRVRVARR